VSTVFMLEPAVFVPPSGRASSGQRGTWDRLAGRHLRCFTPRATSTAVPERKLGAMHDGALLLERTLPTRSDGAPRGVGAANRKQPGD
jgi:hypothetical protein